MYRNDDNTIQRGFENGTNAHQLTGNGPELSARYRALRTTLCAHFYNAKRENDETR